ncbi:hypothetical protein J6590_101346, partial [Homalodisca vitripennis]
MYTSLIECLQCDFPEERRVQADTWTSSSRLRFNGVINRGGEKEWGQSRAEPSSTDKSRTFLTNSVHAADSDLSSER